MRYIQQHHQIILNAKEFEAVQFKVHYGTNFVTLFQIRIVLSLVHIALIRTIFPCVVPS